MDTYVAPYLGYCKQCSCEHWGACIFSNQGFSFFSDKYPGVELLGLVVLLFLVFWETSTLFPTVATPFYIPTDGVGGSEEGLVLKELGEQTHMFLYV